MVCFVGARAQVGQDVIADSPSPRRLEETPPKPDPTISQPQPCGSLHVPYPRPSRAEGSELSRS